MFEQSYRFTFEAAHELSANVEGHADHPYSRVHGHSFEVTATLSARSLGDAKWIEDFGKVKAACAAIEALLDHRLLNDIEGLERPTLERLAEWIFEKLKPTLPALASITVARPTLRESVRYSA